MILIFSPCSSMENSGRSDLLFNSPCRFRFFMLQDAWIFLSMLDYWALTLPFDRLVNVLILAYFYAYHLFDWNPEEDQWKAVFRNLLFLLRFCIPLIFSYCPSILSPLRILKCAFDSRRAEATRRWHTLDRHPAKNSQKTEHLAYLISHTQP